MKSRLFFLLLTLVLGTQGFAQTTQATTPSDADVRKTTEALTAKYNLNADQAKQMYQIQQRKNRNMAQIAAFEQSDIALYQTKLGNIQQGTWANIRRILNTKEQVDLYKKTQGELRQQRGAKRKELTAQKLSKTAIEAAVLNIYAE